MLKCGYAAARVNPMLFTHMVENNRFIVLLAYRPEGDAIGHVIGASLGTMRPNTTNEAHAELLLESIPLSERCGGPDSPDAVCFYDGASEALKYTYDHLDPDSQEIIVKTGKVHSRAPVQHPEGWAERYVVYWGVQEGWACDAGGVNCTLWDMPVPAFDVEHFVFDEVAHNNPPRVIVAE